MAPVWPRTAIGFFATSLSVLTFHQGMWAILHALREMQPPFPTATVASFGQPRTIDLCIGRWGLGGFLFGLVLPILPRGLPMWLLGFGLGILAALVGVFLVAALTGLPEAGYATMVFVRSFLINGPWGIGVGFILSLLLTGVTDPA